MRLSIGAAALVAWLACGGAPPIPRSPDTEPPNILVILIDDLGIEHSGVDFSAPQTPNLGTLAAQDKHLARRCASRNRELFLAVHRRNVDVAAQSHDRVRHRYRDVHIRAVSLEDLVGLHVQR